LIVLDTSALFAALNTRDPDHQAARTALETEQPPFILSPFVLAELDYLIARRAGVDAELDVLRDATAGVYELAGFGVNDIATAVEVIERFHDLEIGLADASIVVLAARYGTDRVFTLDERHFRPLRTLSGKPFQLLPADAT
jgi:uncharacterized protein